MNIGQESYDSCPLLSALQIWVWPIGKAGGIQTLQVEFDSPPPKPVWLYESEPPADIGAPNETPVVEQGRASYFKGDLMKVTPIKHDYIEMMSKSVQATRAQGLHMSDIYNALYAKLEPKRYGKSGGFKSSMYSEMGVILEQTLEEGFRRRLVDAVSERPDEQSVKVPGFALPVYYNPDLFIFEGRHEERIGEIKLTWMSSSEVPRVKGTNGFPSKFDKYFTQMKLYGYARETPYARLIAGFVNGRWDFKDRENGFRPELLAWDIEFSPRELKEEWDTCMGFAKSEKLFEKFEKMMNRRKM